MLNVNLIFFRSQMTLPRWSTFLLDSLTLTFTVLLFWIYFFLLMLVFVLQWLSLHWKILIMWLSHFSLTFHQTQNEIRFHCITYDYSCANWDGLHDHLRDVPLENIFKLSASAATSEFCDWVQTRIYVYLILNIRSSSFISIVFNCLCSNHIS